MQHLALDARPLRVAGVASIAALAALPLVPGHDAVGCPLRAATGVPCPFCGMTRGVGRLVDGDLGGALSLNPGSVLLVLGAVALLLFVRRATIRVPAWAPLLVLAAMWSFQLTKFATGRPL
ncbi:MAG: DUF2752 domain-containing protein [Acidimicrobiia bacterium]